MKNETEVEYLDAPEAIQALIDGAEFLKKVTSLRLATLTLYKFHYEDSSEVWVRVYDANGNKVGESAYLSKE